MLYCEDIINERLSQKNLVLCPLVLTVQNIFAAVNRIDISGTPCTTLISANFWNSGTNTLILIDLFWEFALALR